MRWGCGKALQHPFAPFDWLEKAILYHEKYSCNLSKSWTIAMGVDEWSCQGLVVSLLLHAFLLNTGDYNYIDVLTLIKRPTTLAFAFVSMEALPPIRRTWHLICERMRCMAVASVSLKRLPHSTRWSKHEHFIAHTMCSKSALDSGTHH